MRLRLNESAWRMRTGRLYPGSEPSGCPKSAHQISPRFTPTSRGAAPRAMPPPGPDQLSKSSRHRPARTCMTDKVFVDTHVFVYLFDRDARVKQARAAALVEKEAEAIVISTQVLQEFYV